jgi:RNA polymerase sigma factor (sigma-70 family)
MHASIALSGPIPDENAHIAAAVAAQGPRLRAFVRRQVADLSEVDDIVQDAFVELVSAYRLMEPIVHVAAWLQRVARNRIIDRFRQRSRDDSLIDSSSVLCSEAAPDATGSVAAWLEAPGAGPEVGYARDALAEKLVAAINELPVEQRSVFIAHELDGRSFKELAAETGIGVNTLLGRKHAAVRYLRKRLQDIHSELDKEE